MTGAGQGIGAAIAEGLAATGAEVICTDISRERAAATAQALNAKGYNVRAEGLDVPTARLLTLWPPRTAIGRAGLQCRDRDPYPG